MKTTYFLLLLLSFGLTSKLYANDEQFQQSLQGTALQTGATMSLEDDRYSEMAAGNFSFTNMKVINRLHLQILNPQGIASYSSTVSATIRYEVWNGTAFEVQSKTTELEVNYDSENPYQDQAFIQWEGGHKLQVEITNASNPVANLVLTGSIEVERYEEFDANQAPAASSLSAELIPERGELMVRWEAMETAEEYDLEWTYVNDFSEGNTPKGASAIPLEKNFFKLNSTRISTIQTSYAIPLIYDRGYIIYRLRPIGRNTAAGYPIPVAGRWSFVPQAGHSVADAPHKFLFYGHQTNLNWQATVSFAEEGKHKAAVSYFDGSLRNRQAVSRLNTEDKIIVGETVYDHQGRASVQVLPVPGSTSKIGYQRNFNLNPEGRPYSRLDFDQDLENCIVSPLGMSTASGASLYYSPDNPDKDGHQAFLPNANLFPFTQVEYTPDNTGRIRRQSGVGITHKIGSGHETQYFYGKPFQVELDRLFGVDVGLASHYKKNMVVDANGQVSVSYLDPQGRVVATSLAGETPESLKSISVPEDEVTVTADLLGKIRPGDRQGTEGRLSPDGQTKTLTQEILVSQEGTRSFNYNLEAETYREGSEICYDCVLDLAISLTDDCGEALIEPIGPNASTSLTIGASSLECEEAEGTIYSRDFASIAPLSVGNYSLAKTLSINQDALDQYTEDYIRHLGEDELKSFDFFLEQEAAKIEIVACVSNCETCIAAVEDQRPDLTQAEYEELLEACDWMCDESSVQCENALQMLLADISPFGQYGEVMDGNALAADGTFETGSGKSVNPYLFDLSVFNDNLDIDNDELRSNKLFKREGMPEPNWRNPYHYETKQTAYLNEQRQPEFIDVLVLEANTFSPELREEATVPANLQPGQVFQAIPQDLQHVEDFLRLWKPSWAQSLVVHHPEFTYYEFCLSVEESHKFDTDWLEADNVDRALQLGYLSGGNTPDPTAVDPYFTQQNENHANSYEQEFMQRALLNYVSGYSIWEVVHRTINCPAYDPDISICNDCQEDDGINTDAEWNTFKSLYINIKQKLIERKMSLYAIDHNSYNGCIGAENENPFKFFSRKFLLDFLSGNQICSAASRDLYIEKTKRFPLHSDMVENNQELDFEACYGSLDADEEPVQNEDVDFEIIECTDNLLGLIEEAKLKVDYEFYERCGQCPLAHDLQTLFSGIAQKDGLQAENFLLSCYPESNYPEWVPALEKEVSANWAAKGKIYWSRSNTAPAGEDKDQELVARLGLQDAAESCEIKFRILEGDYSLSDIKDVCCLEYQPNPQVYAFEENKNFTFKASVGTEGKKITVEGISSCLDISGCSFSPSCETTAEASDLQTLFNALVFDFEVGEDNQDLASGENIDLRASRYLKFIDGRLPSVGGNIQTWKGTDDGNVLNATLSSTEGDCQVQLFKTTNAFAFKDIIGFKSIRVDKDHADYQEDLSQLEHYFVLSARVKTASGEANVELKGFAGCIRIGNCKAVEAPALFN